MTIVVTIQRSREAAGGTALCALVHPGNAHTQCRARFRGRKQAHNQSAERASALGNYCADAMIDRDDQTPRPRPTRYRLAQYQAQPMVCALDPRGTHRLRGDYCFAAVEDYWHWEVMRNEMARGATSKKL